MRRQEGSDGCSVAQVRDLISGWAGAVMGEMEVSFAGRVVLLGKRIGDMNGLHWLVAVGRSFIKSLTDN